MIPFRRILVATDFGDSSNRAVDLAVSLALTHGAKLTLVHAYSSFVPLYPIALAPDTVALREGAEKAMAETLRDLHQLLPDAQGVVRPGDAWKEILEYSEEWAADLIVMGTHGYAGVAHFFLGSVAEKVVRSSSTPVLTVREPGREAELAAE